MNKKGLILFLAAILSVAANANFEEDFFEDDVQTIRLEETVITGEISETTVKDVPKNITIVTSEDIEEKGAKSVIEALEGVAGLKSYEGFGFGSLELRGEGGAHNSNVLILVDGIKQNPIDLGSARTNNIAIENVERIEVIPSGGAVLYGDGAVGGVINIITKKSIANESNREISMESGNNGLFAYGLNISQSLGEKSLVNLNYNKKDRDGYRENGHYNVENFEFGTNYEINEVNKIKYNFGHYEEVYGLPGSLSKDQLDDDRKQTNYPDKEGTYITDSHTLSYTYDFSNNLKFIIDTNFRQNDYESLDGDGKDYEYTNTQTMIKPKVKLTYDDFNSNVIVGYDYYMGTADVKAYSGNEVDRDLTKTSNSLFAFNTYNYKKFQFIQGLRFERTDYDLKTDDTLEASLWAPATYTDADTSNTAIEFAGNYFYSESGNAYISYNRGFRTPNTGELANSDDDIKEQTHDCIEIGIKDLIFNSFVSVNLYSNNVEDEIYYSKTTSNNTNRDGEVQKNGFELSAEQYLGKLTLNETYTYINTEMKSGDYKGNEIPGISKHRWSLTGNYNFNEQVTLNASANYTGEAYYNGDNENSRDKQYAYTTVNSKLSYDFNNGLLVHGGINNLFDIEYDNYAGVYYSSWTNQDVYYYYPAAKRTYNLGFTYNF